MSSVRLRPKFVLRSSMTSDAALRNVRDAVADEHDFVHGQFVKRHAMISIVESSRHFWSPWLNMEFNDVENGCEIRGRFSPHPTIWTAFMFSYFSLALLSFFSVIVGVSQQLAKLSPWRCFLLPIFLLIAIALWIASQAGQKLADSEMRKLKDLAANSISDSRELPNDD